MAGIHKRYLKNPVAKDLGDRMVFIGGPRQVGKTDRREVGFVVLEDGKPLFAVECKAGEKNINPSLYYFIERTNIPTFFQVHAGNRDSEKDKVRVLPVRTLCKELQLP